MLHPELQRLVDHFGLRVETDQAGNLRSVNEEYVTSHWTSLTVTIDGHLSADALEAIAMYVRENYIIHHPAPAIPSAPASPPAPESAGASASFDPFPSESRDRPA